MSLRSPDGTAFDFDAGSPCLTLAHTGAEEPWDVFESLHEPSDLADWLAGPPLGLTLDHTPTVGELHGAREVRDAIRRAAWSVAGGETISGTDRETINAAAAEPSLVPLIADRSGIRWQEPVLLAGVLSTLARDAIDLCCGPRADRLRLCGAPDCLLVFVDTSRPGTRRWCSMQRCGNRNKARSHRRRSADTRPETTA